MPAAGRVAARSQHISKRDHGEGHSKDHEGNIKKIEEFDGFVRK
jgi:hypothetical protein